MRDRRLDDRVNLENLDCVLYVTGFNEIAAKVKDISEVGIAFEIAYDEKIFQIMQNIKKLSFSFLDTYVFLDTEIEQILQGICEIARVVKKKDTIIVGCKLNADSELKHYITQKKVINFMDLIHRATGERGYRHGK